MQNQITINKAEYELLKKQSAQVQALEEQAVYLKTDFEKLRQGYEELSKENERLKISNEEFRKGSEVMYLEKCRIEKDMKRANRIIDALITVMEGNK